MSENECGCLFGSVGSQEKLHRIKDMKGDGDYCSDELLRSLSRLNLIHF